MADKLERAIAATGRVFLEKHVARYSTSQRWALCATSTFPHSIPQPAQLSKRLFASTRLGSMSLYDVPQPSPAEEVVGQSGSRYTVLETLQDKGRPWGGVYLATDDSKARVVLKEIPQDWRFRNEMYDMAAGCRHIRVPIDAVPERRILVFRYLDKHLLYLAQEDIPLTHIKRILYYTLQGIADLHARDILHNDIKANNILVQMMNCPANPRVDEVLITDLEDSAHLKPGQSLKGAPLGNFMWRSPEAHAEGPMRTPSDLFAFGIVCIYAVTKTLIFEDNNPEATEDDRTGTAIFRQMSYFADEDGIQGLLEYLGEDHPMRETFQAIEELYHKFAGAPFVKWQLPGLDDDSKDLITKLTKLDPRKRITAQEALAHKWFRDI